MDFSAAALYLDSMLFYMLICRRNKRVIYQGSRRRQLALMMEKKHLVELLELYNTNVEKRRLQ